MIYTWVNDETGEVTEVQRKMADIDVSPITPGPWRRVISPFGTGRVQGAGGSPAMPSTPLRKSRKGPKAPSKTYMS